MLAKRLSFRDEWKVNTIDITVAVLLGVVQGVIVVVGALDYLNRVAQTTGVGGVIASMIILGLFGTLIVTAGFLRKRILVPIIAGVVLALIRWFTGDPDGALILIWWGIAPFFFGLVLWAFRWKDSWWVYALGGAAMVAWAAGSWWWLFGIRAMGFASYAAAHPTAILSGFILSGILGYLLAKAVQKVGIAVVER
jgi:hypothetical protein